MIVVATEAEAVAQRAVQQSYLTYAFSLCILSFAVVMVIAGRIQDMRGPRFTAIVGAVLMGLGFGVAGLMTKPIVFYLAHAAFAGAVGIVLLMMFEALFGKVDRDEVRTVIKAIWHKASGGCLCHLHNRRSDAPFKRIEFRLEVCGTPLVNGKCERHCAEDATSLQSVTFPGCCAKAFKAEVWCMHEYVQGQPPCGLRVPLVSIFQGTGTSALALRGLLDTQTCKVQARVRAVRKSWHAERRIDRHAGVVREAHASQCRGCDSYS